MWSADIHRPTSFNLCIAAGGELLSELVTILISDVKTMSESPPVIMGSQVASQLPLLNHPSV